MFNRFKQFLRAGLVALTIAGGTAMLPADAFAADKIHLKDGRVLEGKIVREGDGFIFIQIQVGALKQEQLITKDQIAKIERETPAGSKTDEKLEEEKKQSETDKSSTNTGKHRGATRVAILNFGAPSDWLGRTDSTVGKDITAEAFRRVIPMLEKAKTEVVVVRVNSGGGALLELQKFQDVFEKEYKPRFRTVAWIESAISAAAMSPWVLEEFYFMPEGNMGACTGWYGALQAVKGVELEMVLAQMEKASAKGKRDFKIMRSMQIQEPLSVDFDANGEVVWRQDFDGELKLNPPGQVFTITAQDAIKTKFALGIAATRDELAKAMKLEEVEWVAKDASEAVDEAMRESDKAFKQFEVVYQKYATAVGLAEQLQDKQRRGAQIAIARRHLEELRRWVRQNSNFPLFIGLPPNWFQLQEEHLKELAARP